MFLRPLVACAETMYTTEWDCRVAGGFVGRFFRMHQDSKNVSAAQPAQPSARPPQGGDAAASSRTESGAPSVPAQQDSTQQDSTWEAAVTPCSAGGCLLLVRHAAQAMRCSFTPSRSYFSLA